MRARLLAAGAAVLLLVFLAVGSLAVVQGLKSRDPFYGTFTNEQMSPEKWVTFPGGFKSYVLASDRLPADEATERIVVRWTDSDGNRWYRTQATMGSRKILTLQEITADGNVRKFTESEVADFSSHDFPTTFPQAGSYTWYRTANY